MNIEEKHSIAKELDLLVAKESQVKIANKCGVSNGTISQIINQNWKNITPGMFRKIKTALKIDTGWHTGETTNYRQLNQLLAAAQMKSLAIGIAHDAGTGKSHTYREYQNTYENVMHVECNNYWSKKSYVKALLMSAGFQPVGTTEEMIEEFIEYVRGLEKPLIILDQIDKLKDNQMDLFMDLYNALEYSCGFVISGVPALEKRIVRGVQRDKIGYRELYSRIGRKFIKLEKITLKDVTEICQANLIYEEEVILEIFADCDGDLRRVRKDINRYFLLQKSN